MDYNTTYFFCYGYNIYHRDAGRYHVNVRGQR